MTGPYDKLEKKAEELENQSKLEFKKKNFAPVITLLEEAKAIYTELGFHGKITMINQKIGRIRNLIDHEEKGKSIRSQKEQEFQGQIQELINEKQRYEQKLLAKQNALTPEIKKKIEKINMLKLKSEKEEKLGNYPRVIGRYEYILELYNSIPRESIDLSDEISEIENNLLLLKKKNLKT